MVQDVEDLKTSDQQHETMMRLEIKIDTVITAMDGGYENLSPASGKNY